MDNLQSSTEDALRERDEFERIVHGHDLGIVTSPLDGLRLAEAGPTEHLDVAFEILAEPADMGNSVAQKGLYVLNRRADYPQNNLAEAYKWRLLSERCSTTFDGDGEAVLGVSYEREDQEARQQDRPGPPSDLDAATLAEATELADQWVRDHEGLLGEDLCDPHDRL
ncbi:MAG: hypothetical protein AAF563_00900 [Pseudomonadota bacterium]